MYILITCCYSAVLKWEPDCWNGIKSSSHAIGLSRTQLKIQDEAFCENSSSKSHVFIIRLGSEYVSARKRKPLREVSKYGDFSGPYFPVFSPNVGKYGPE